MKKIADNVEIIALFLTNRQRTVKVNGTLYEWLKVTLRMLIMRLHFTTFSETILLELVAYYFSPRSGHSHDAAGRLWALPDVF